MRLGSLRKGGEEAKVEITPLIDMVFILLIFFMVTTTFVKDFQVELERPSAASAETYADPASWIWSARCAASCSRT